VRGERERERERRERQGEREGEREIRYTHLRDRGPRGSETG
jgi:hypothetical protein